MGILIGEIVTAATTVVKALSGLGLAVQGFKALGSIMVGFAKALGLLKPQTEVEDLGDRALQSGYDPENFDSHADYVKAVEEYDLDPEKSKLTTEEEKITKGMELAAGAAIEKFKEYPLTEFLIETGSNREFFTEDKMREIGKLIENAPENISSILDYLNGSEKNDAKLNNTINTLIGVEKSVNPSITDQEALRSVVGVRK